MYGKKRIQLSKNGQIIRVGGKSFIPIGFWTKSPGGNVSAIVTNPTIGGGRVDNAKTYTGRSADIRKTLANEFMSD